MNLNFKKNIVFWLILIGILFGLSDFLDNSSTHTNNEIGFSDFLIEVNKENVTKLSVKGNEISGEFKDGKTFTTLAMNYPEFVKELRDKKVEFKVDPLMSKIDRIMKLIGSWLPFILIIGIWIYFMKGAGGGGGGAFKFGKSKAKMLLMKGKITFKDVAGIDEAKEELKELVDFLKESTKYTKLGAKIPRGCLLGGEPGTGKSLLARAIAGEANVPFFFISGSDFVEMFVGVGASRVRDMFDEAKKNSPCLIFIDEIDAVGRQRGVGLGGGNDEREQTLNQLLVEMDGFEGNEGIIVIAATNRADVLDKALLRPGRFDRQIYVNLPDHKGREEILAVHSPKVKMATDVDLSILAKATPGFSGADLANLINEAALLTARNDKKRITMREAEEALDKVRMGLAKKSRIIKEKDRKLTAYHEAGHAIVALNCKNVDPIHKITIIPRGYAGGVTWFLPEDDKKYERKIEMLEDIMISFGGRIAEEIIFGEDEVTGGASGDIKMATKLAERMVTSYGFSKKLGPINYEKKRRNDSDYKLEGSSDTILNLIDTEIKDIIVEQKKKAEVILNSKKKDLIKLAEALLKYETLNKEQIDLILKGKSIDDTFEKQLIDVNGVNVSLLTTSFDKIVDKEKEKKIKDISVKIVKNIKKKIKKISEIK
jgi:cell division protease FtsH